jgi:hypothetical protein
VVFHERAACSSVVLFLFIQNILEKIVKIKIIVIYSFTVYAQLRDDFQFIQNFLGIWFL